MIGSTSQKKNGKKLLVKMEYGKTKVTTVPSKEMFGMKTETLWDLYLMDGRKILGM